MGGSVSAAAFVQNAAKTDRKRTFSEAMPNNNEGFWKFEKWLPRAVKSN